MDLTAFLAEQKDRGSAYFYSWGWKTRKTSPDITRLPSDSEIPPPPKEKNKKAKLDPLSLVSLSEYSPGLQYLLARGIPQEDLEFFDISISPDFPRRVIIPSLDGQGEWDYWQARDTTGISRVKYISPPHGRPLGVLMNLAHIRKHYDTTILCEGPISAMIAGRNGSCTYGYEFTEDQIARLSTMDFRRIYVAYDGDTGGQRQAIRLCSELRAWRMEPWMIKIPEGKDPGDIGRSGMQRHIDEAYLYTDFSYAREVLMS